MYVILHLRMRTILFVENKNATNGPCGYQLTKHNFHRVPSGRIHIARFTTGFVPTCGLGYYGDTYFRQLIRNWKHKVVLKKNRRMEKVQAALCLYQNPSLNGDIIRYIVEYL